MYVFIYKFSVWNWIFILFWFLIYTGSSGDAYVTGGDGKACGDGKSRVDGAKPAAADR